MAIPGNISAPSPIFSDCKSFIYIFLYRTFITLPYIANLAFERKHHANLRDKVKKIVWSIFLLVLAHADVHAEVIFKNLGGLPSSLTINGYIEGYYGYDLPASGRHDGPKFLGSFDKNDRPAVNLAFIKGSYTSQKVRANLGFAGGSYVSANYIAEPAFLKNLFESNIGIKLSDNKNLWLDIGVFPSHIGLESAIGKENWTLTRAMGADNTPYFETGAKIGYTSNNGKWFVSALILNGWQHIKPIEGNTLPSFGTQVIFKPSDRISVNSSTFLGTDKPDSSRQMRFFHNLYGIFTVNDVFATIVGFDIGLEQRSKSSSAMNIWFNPVIILRYKPTQKLSFAVRGEYYSDKHHVMIAAGNPRGFKTYGFSANMDYQITPHLLWRVEGRALNSAHPIFIERMGALGRELYSITTSLALYF